MLFRLFSAVPEKIQTPFATVPPVSNPFPILLAAQFFILSNTPSILSLQGYCSTNSGTKTDVVLNRNSPLNLPWDTAVAYLKALP